MNQFAVALMGCGIGLLTGLLILWITRPEKPRVSGFSDEDTELLNMPAHERLARQLAVQHGVPEFLWRRYTPLAVAMILEKKQ
ncbi:hypothetical protein [Bradyrhizobium sp. SZCCHNR3118]|uniref:hypothetical protein n=1 Tax=Bradyrhizobium sp. SZCCHNR3118 TaxID=3057468 RepID=UPI0029164966|nr:hypothetical protein [Bradyrhizobium sp. SZCCHNR3118]